MRLPKSERYSKVYRSMWADERFLALSAPTPNAQSLWMYILTGHHVSAVPGLWRFSLGQTAETLRWAYEDTLRCFDELTDAGMANYDRRAGTIWLPNAYRYNKPNATSVVDGWREPLAEIPECALKREAVVVLAGWLAEIGPKFAEAFRRATGDMPRMASPNPSGLSRAAVPTGRTTGSGTKAPTSAASEAPNTTGSGTGSGVKTARDTTTSASTSASTSGQNQPLPVPTASGSAKHAKSARMAGLEHVNTTAGTTASAGLIVESQAQKEKEKEEPPYPPTAKATPDGPRVGSNNNRTQSPSVTPTKTTPSVASGSPSRAPEGRGGGNGASSVPDSPVGPSKADGGDLSESELLPTDAATSRASFAVQIVHRLTNGKIGNVLSDTDMRTLEARIRTLQSRDGSLPRDIFVTFSKWLVEGGNDGSGGLSWSHMTTTWQWLIKDRRLETHLSEAQAWAASKQLGERVVDVIADDSPEEEAAMNKERKAAIIASCCSPAFVAMRNKGKKPEDRVQLLGQEEAFERMCSIFDKKEARRRVDDIFSDLKRRGAVA